MEGMDEERPMYYPVQADLSPFTIPVFISAPLSDRLEVPEDWQWIESFDDRVREMLLVAEKAIEEASDSLEEARFTCEVPDPLTHRDELISLKIRVTEEGAFVDQTGRLDA
jgi:hypothetical protein